MSLSDILPDFLVGDTGFDGDEVDDTGNEIGQEGASTDDASGDDASDEAIVYECRECGTTVGGKTQPCPSCGSGEIAEYPVE